MIATKLRRYALWVLCVGAGASTGFAVGRGISCMVRRQYDRESIVSLLQSGDSRQQITAIDLMEQAATDAVVDLVVDWAIAPSFSVHRDYSHGDMARLLQRCDTPLIARSIIRKRESLDRADLSFCANLLRGKSDFESYDLLQRMVGSNDSALSAAATDALSKYPQDFGRLDGNESGNVGGN